MKKKIILPLICFIFIVSCGKKADPEYKAEKYITEFEQAYKYINF
tara:strand:- start:198 stop:332 length:135 start_codon:yes stop_codon:yes gene_type:complete